MKPMLSAEAPDNLTFPLYASYKLDGIRAIVDNGRVLSRSLKLIPNAYVQKILTQTDDLHGFDGELIVGASNDFNAMQNTMSGVMSQAGEPDVTYWVFDIWDLESPYDARLEMLQTIVADLQQNPIWEGRVKVLQQHIIHDVDQLNGFETRALELGYEGIMLRKMDAPYKFGRSTAREGYLMKLKRWVDFEAEIIGFVELERNDNEPIKDALGYQRRSTHKANKTPMNMLGAFQMRALDAGYGKELQIKEFECGGGFTQRQRIDFWANREMLLGKIGTCKAFPIGVKDRARMPIWKSFRHPIDMST